MSLKAQLPPWDHARPAARNRSAVPPRVSTTERADRQFFIRRGGTFASTRTTCPALSSQIRSSGNRIVNVCTERQRGMCSAGRLRHRVELGQPLHPRGPRVRLGDPQPARKITSGQTVEARARARSGPCLSRCRTRRHCAASSRAPCSSERAACRSAPAACRSDRPSCHRTRETAWPPREQPSSCAPRPCGAASSLAFLTARFRSAMAALTAASWLRTAPARSRVKSLRAAAAIAGSGVATLGVGVAATRFTDGVGVAVATTVTADRDGSDPPSSDGAGQHDARRYRSRRRRPRAARGARATGASDRAGAASTGGETGAGAPHDRPTGASHSSSSSSAIVRPSSGSSTGTGTGSEAGATSVIDAVANAGAASCSGVRVSSRRRPVAAAVPRVGRRRERARGSPRVGCGSGGVPIAVPQGLRAGGSSSPSQPRPSSSSSTHSCSSAWARQRSTLGSSWASGGEPGRRAQAQRAAAGARGESVVRHCSHASSAAGDGAASSPPSQPRSSSQTSRSGPAVSAAAGGDQDATAGAAASGAAAALRRRAGFRAFEERPSSRLLALNAWNHEQRDSDDGDKQNYDFHFVFHIVPVDLASE